MQGSQSIRIPGLTMKPGESVVMGRDSPNAPFTRCLKKRQGKKRGMQRNDVRTNGHTQTILQLYCDISKQT